MAQFMSAGFPLELVAAKKADRIAWISNDKGLRNVFTAAAPGFKPVRVTSFMKDDGVDTTQLSISDDGSTVTFTRGHEKNRLDWVASPEADPRGVERAIWAAKTAAPGTAWRLAEGSNGVLSPDGRSCRVGAGRPDSPRRRRAAGPRVDRHRQGREAVHPHLGHQQQPGLVARQPQDRVRVAAHRSQLHRGLRPRVAQGDLHVPERGLRQQPDVGARQQADRVRPAPGDAVRAAVAGRRRRPGQSRRAGGWTRRAGGRGGGGGGQGRGGRGGDQPAGRHAARAAAGADDARRSAAATTCRSGSADVATGDAQEFWHNAPQDRVYTNINQITWRGEHVVFQIEPEEWTRYYAVPVRDRPAPPQNTGPTDRTALFGRPRRRTACRSRSA